jgi:hypothetical protein
MEEYMDAKVAADIRKGFFDQGRQDKSRTAEDTRPINPPRVGPARPVYTPGEELPPYIVKQVDPADIRYAAISMGYSSEDAHKMAADLLAARTPAKPEVKKPKTLVTKTLGDTIDMTADNGEIVLGY